MLIKPKFLSPEPKKVNPVPNISSRYSISSASIVPLTKPIDKSSISGVSYGNNPSSQPGSETIVGILSATYFPTPWSRILLKSSRSEMLSSLKSQNSCWHCFSDTLLPSNSHLNSLNFIICSGEEQIDGLAGVPSSYPFALTEYSCRTSLNSSGKKFPIFFANLAIAFLFGNASLKSVCTYSSI